jgi:lysophospholipase L1-like esterase
MAKEYGDIVLPITKLAKDNVHPTTKGYKELAEKTK